MATGSKKRRHEDDEPDEGHPPHEGEKRQRLYLGSLGSAGDTSQSRGEHIQVYQFDRSEEQRSRDRRKGDAIVIRPSENIIPGVEEQVDMFVTDTVAVDVEPRVENLRLLAQVLMSCMMMSGMINYLMI